MFSFSNFTSSTFERTPCVGSDDLGLPAGLAKVRVTVVWIRAGGTSVGRLPCAFDLYTQLTRGRYNEKRTDPMVRPSNEIRAGAGREKQ